MIKKYLKYTRGKSNCHQPALYLFKPFTRVTFKTNYQASTRIRLLLGIIFLSQFVTFSGSLLSELYRTAAVNRPAPRGTFFPFPPLPRLQGFASFLFVLPTTREPDDRLEPSPLKTDLLQKYGKIPKISPPNTSPQTRNATKPSVISPLQIEAPRGLVLGNCHQIQRKKVNFHQRIRLLNQF